jgi:hypothetical protein
MIAYGLVMAVARIYLRSIQSLQNPGSVFSSQLFLLRVEWLQGLTVLRSRSEIYSFVPFIGRCFLWCSILND